MSDSSPAEEPADTSDAKMIALLSAAMTEKFTANGIAPNISTFDAMNLFVMVGQRLRTVEKQIRPQLRAQIRNFGERWRDDGKPTAQSVLIEMMVASWDNIGDSDEAMRAAFDAAIRDAKSPPGTS